MTADENPMCTVRPLKLYWLIPPSMRRQPLPVSSYNPALVCVCWACSSSHFPFQQPTGAERRRCFSSGWRGLGSSPLSQLKYKPNNNIEFSIGASLPSNFVQWPLTKAQWLKHPLLQCPTIQYDPQSLPATGQELLHPSSPASSIALSQVTY